MNNVSLDQALVTISILREALRIACQDVDDFCRDPSCPHNPDFYINIASKKISTPPPTPTRKTNPS